MTKSMESERLSQDRSSNPMHLHSDQDTLNQVEVGPTCPPQHATTTCKLRDLIIEHQRMYDFACITGIIWPTALENHDTSHTKQNLRYRSWSYYLYIAFACNSCVMFAFAIYEFSRPGSKGTIISGLEAMGIFFQNLLIIPPLVFLQRDLSAEREINRSHYLEALDYCYFLGRAVLVLLIILMIIFTIVLCVYIDYPMMIYEGLVTFFTFIPGNCFLAGVFTFLVVELRVTYQVLPSPPQNLATLH